MAYERNDSVRLSVSVYQADALVAPTTLQVKVLTPLGGTATYTLAGSQLTVDGTGRYHVDVQANAAGRWAYTWTAVLPGGATKLASSTFAVREPLVS